MTNIATFNSGNEAQIDTQQVSIWIKEEIDKDDLILESDSVENISPDMNQEEVQNKDVNADAQIWKTFEEFTIPETPVNNMLSEPQMQPNLIIIPKINELGLKIGKLIDEVSEIKRTQNTILSNIAQINAKLDSLGSSSTTTTTTTIKNIELIPTVTLTPILNLEQLKETNESAKNEDFVQETVLGIGRICGKKSMIGNGRSVGLRIIDKIFERKFLTECSWTGGARGRIEKKIPLSHYSALVNMIEQIIFYSDESWTTAKNEHFMRSILNNSAARSIRDKRVRTPSSRPKAVKISNENIEMAEISIPKNENVED